MKLDDTGKDYFLHDFESNDEQTPARNPEESLQPVSEGERETAAPSFDFGGGSGNGETPRPAVSEKPRKRHHFKAWFFTILALLLAVTVYVRYFVPYVTESRSTGYVTLVEKRGIVFHTFEGEMVSESLLSDTSRVYTRDVYFSIPDDSLALRLQKYQGTGRAVTITCKRYYGTLPWRGASNTVLESFEPAAE